MAITQEITRIQGAKADIKSAIEAKGVTVPSNALIDTYDDYVANIDDGSWLFDVMDGTTNILRPPKYFNLGGMNAVSAVEFPASCNELPNFKNCINLYDINIPSTVTTRINNRFVGSGLQYCYCEANYPLYTFSDCNNLRLLDVEANVGNIAATKNATNLLSVTFNDTTPPTVPSGQQDLFLGCTSLSHIYVPAESVDAYKAAVVWSTYASIIEPIPTTIMDYNFVRMSDALDQRNITETFGEATTLTIDGTDYTAYPFDNYSDLYFQQNSNVQLDGRRRGLYMNVNGYRKFFIDNLKAGDIITFYGMEVSTASPYVPEWTLYNATLAPNGGELIVTNDGAVGFEVKRRTSITHLRVVRPTTA